MEPFLYCSLLKNVVRYGRYFLYFFVQLSNTILTFPFAKVPPQIVPFEFGTEPANVGEMTTVSCLVAKGDLPLDIFWSLNSIPLIQGQQGVSVMRLNARTSVITVESLDAQHRGLYRCMARNGAGQSEHYSALEVNGYQEVSPVPNIITDFAHQFKILIFQIHPTTKFPTCPLRS